MSDQNAPIELSELRWWATDWLVHLIAEQNFVTITPVVLDRLEGENAEEYTLDKLSVRLPELKRLQADVARAIDYLERGSPPSSTRAS
jgi:hypothetical protein